MSEKAERIVRAMIAGQVTMCQAAGCSHTFPPGEGKSNRVFCGEPDCTRNRRVRPANRRQALTDIKAEMDELGGAPLEHVQEGIHELNNAIKDGAISDEDLRVAAVKLAAAAANVAVLVDALGRGGLSSQVAPRPALPRGGSTGNGRSPAQDGAARAMLEASS